MFSPKNQIIFPSNQMFSPKKSSKKRGMKMLQRLKKIDAEKKLEPPIALKSANLKTKQKQTTTESTSTISKSTKNERERPKRDKKEARRNLISGDVLIQAEAKFVKHGKGESFFLFY